MTDVDTSPQFNGDGYIFSHFVPNISGHSRVYVIHRNGDLKFCGAEQCQIETDEVLLTTDWKHLAISWDDDFVRAYVNGQLVTVREKLATDFQGIATLGGFMTGVDHYDGLIDSLRVYDQVLSHLQILQVVE